MRALLGCSLLLLAIAGCGRGSPSSLAVMNSWTPKYVKRRLGRPVTVEGPFEGVCALQYRGITFIYLAREDAERIGNYNRIKSVVIKDKDLSQAAQEFLAVIPSGLFLGCSIVKSEQVLGDPDRIDQRKAGGVKMTWHIHDARAGDWRNYWLRFDGRELSIINISPYRHEQFKD